MSFPCENWGKGRGVFIFVIMAEEIGASKGWGGGCLPPQAGVGCVGRHEAQLSDQNNIPYPKNQQ